MGITYSFKAEASSNLICIFRLFIVIFQLAVGLKKSRPNKFSTRKETQMLKTIPTTPWLFPEEQPEVVERLLEWNLIEFNNERNLPLKMGGTTDVYIKVRDARDTPESVGFVTDLFAGPIRRLGVDRFVEVPDSVSCFAGPLLMKTGIPYLTIREKAKEGRVADAKVIGHPMAGESVCIIDDVITNGESKIVPINECTRLGIHNRALVVLVDRQQGWKEHLTKAGINVPVWAGMTLHDVRRHLINTLGAMERCSKKTEEENPMIVAPAGKDWDEILPVVDQLRTSGCILKVNDLLFDEGIDHLLPNLSVYGRVMADIKCPDIPNTVANTCKRLRPHAPWAVTVHASGGKDMIDAAVKTLEGTQTLVLAVTVLTSLKGKDCEEVYTRRPIEQVMALADIAHRAGAHGLVCSPKEVKRLRKKYPKMTLVTPGIRSSGVDAGDQKRVATPNEAMENGADHIVMGRQIFGVDDPVAEVRRVLSEELSASL